MNRRDFIKRLYLVPSIPWLGKVRFELFVDLDGKNSYRYKDILYSGNAGGGKTMMLYSNPTGKKLGYIWPK